MQLSLLFKYMFETFLFMGYSRKTSNYPKRIVLSDPTHMMSIVHIAIDVEISKIDSGCSLEKEVTYLIHVNP